MRKIARTITTTTAEVIYFNVVTQETSQCEHMAVGRLTEDSFRKDFEESNITYKFIMLKTKLDYSNELYSMSQKDFIKYASVVETGNNESIKNEMED